MTVISNCVEIRNDCDLKATGPAGQHKMNCCGPNWPDDLKKCMRASVHIANVEPCSVLSCNVLERKR